MVEDVPLAVHLRVVAVPEEAALPHGEGGVVHQGPVQQVAKLRQVVQLPPEGLEQAGGVGLQQVPQVGQLAQAGGQGDQVPAPGRAVDHPADEPL